MMKKLTLGFFISAMVLFTGCSQKYVLGSGSESETESGLISSSENSSTDETGVKLSNVYFDFDKFTINSDMRSVLKTTSTKIIDSDNANVVLEGHCDERGSNEYNFALGLKRAGAVKSELVNYGVSVEQIKIVSYGENKPLCTDQTKDCWSKNRRVEVIVK